MKQRSIWYWIVTSLFALMMLGSAIPDVLVVQMAVDGFRAIGLPAYLLPFLGIAKILGVAGILIPGFPRLREWSYAGLLFDVIGATYCIAAAGMPVDKWAPTLIVVALGFGSYALYHRQRKSITNVSRDLATA